MAKSRWVGIGGSQLVEAPDSPAWDFLNTETSCVVIFFGPYEQCLAKKPAIGVTMAGYGDTLGLRVTNCKVTKSSGSKGKLVVTLKITTESTTTVSTDVPKYEIDWAQTERKLTSHSRYEELVPVGIAAVEAALAETNATERAAMVAELEGDPLAKDLYEKMVAGQDTFLVFNPVARRTTYHYFCPKTGKCGTKSTLPTALNSAAPSGYEWLKTADRAVNGADGKWERIEEWTGFETIDTDIYASA